MITTIRTFTRPSTTVAWWHDSSLDSLAFNKRLQDDFVATGKIINRVVMVDDLTITVTIRWATKKDMDAHYNNALNIAYFKRRDDYNAANGITTTFSQA